MIVEGLVAAVAGFVKALLGALPSVSWSPDLSGLGTVVGVFKGWDMALHGTLTPVVSVIGAVFLYQAASWLYHAANWLYHHIPFVSGGG